jgi:uncharacterized membrane protein
MNVVVEVLEELWSMFVGDRRLTLLVLALVALATAATRFHAAGVAIAAALLIGALAVLTDSVLQAAAKARR